MSKIDSTLTNYLDSLDWLKNPTCTYLASGHGNDNYRIDDGDQTYVLRLKRKDEFPDSLRREYTLYSFLEAEGYDFTPRAIYYDDTERILIESYVPGSEILHRDLTTKQISQFAERLSWLHELDVDRFQAYCTRHQLTIPPLADPFKSLQQYGFDRFTLIDPDTVGRKLHSWLLSELNQNYSRLLTKKETSQQTSCVMGRCTRECSLSHR